MKTKSESITLENLNPTFTKPLQKFDLMHKNMLGSQVVVTSVDTGKHWGSIKKEDRPYGWQAFTEERVREFSDSKHYTEPLCDALDFRRKCPYGEKKYYDDLTESEQRYFRTEIYKCFPDDMFDIVFSRACIHVEIDQKKSRLDIPEPRIKQQPDYVIPEVPPDVNFIERQIVVSELERLWYEINGRAVILGTVNFLTRKLTGFAFFKDRKDDQSIFGRLLELINIIINKMKGTKS